MTSSIQREENSSKSRTPAYFNTTKIHQLEYIMAFKLKMPIMYLQKKSSLRSVIGKFNYESY